MYLIIKRSQEQFRSGNFSSVVSFCLNNRLVRSGLSGCTKLNEGVEIWRELPFCSVLVKTCREEGRYKIA